MEPTPKRTRRSKGVDTCNWTTAMDEVLIDAYLYQQTLGNKNGNNMTTTAMDNILQELKNYFPDKPVSKDKIKDHMKHIKTKFNVCYDIFKNGPSGFAWDATTNMWIAEPEVWEKLIQAKPEAAEWQNKPILFYDKLVKLFGKDRATRRLEDTPCEVRAKRTTNGRNNYAETIEEISHMVKTNEVTLEGFEDSEEVLPNNSPNRASIGHSQHATSARTKKRAKKVVEDDTSMVEIDKTFKKMVDVFEMSTIEMIKQSKNASSEDIWAQLVDVGIEQASLPLYTCTLLNILKH